MSADTGRYSRRRFLRTTGAAAGTLAIAGCTQKTASDGDEARLSGTIDIAGSSTVFPLATAVSENFMEKYSKVNINLQSTGTGGGFANNFCPGRTDFNNASRKITNTELQSCQENGVVPVELKIATDALTVIVNPAADWIDCVTVEELKEIWSASSPPQQWSDVRSDWPDEEIKLFGPSDASGTFDYFKEAILGEDGPDHRRDYSATEQDRNIIQGVQGSEYAMGYLGYAYYSENKDSVKALGIDAGDGCVEPSLETAKSGEYQPFSRPLFTYANRDSLSEKHIAEFARYWLNEMTNADLVAKKVGYVPLTESEQSAQLETLEAAIKKAN
ncbi:MAG: phosphate ABC transporter substrate-binding protein PstS family protein [Halanaeroarchaeum sp.]